ncbi:hypothetical protein AAG570_001421 [Ranatra chinensis]|uniref:COP9 signalosome complex subunit 8 n=1 Tax=Ranatra chinensis TaxID=642074 RepID=A0ABD0YBT6_9HEMI
MTLDNLNTVAAELEKQELQAQGGVSSPLLYTKLLAIYLYQNDLCNAKFLWKRIPSSVKAGHPELELVWSVGRAMWKRDAPAVFTALNGTQWSENVGPIMRSLVGKVRERGLRLVAQAYSSLSIDTCSSLLGLSPSEVVEFANQQGWGVDDNKMMISPVRPPPPITHITSSEDQLHKLTDFVAFLEN